MADDVANLGQLGAFRQGLDQSQLTADQQAAQTAAYEPFGRLDRYGAGITSLAGGVGGPQYQAPAAPSPFSTALSTALGIIRRSFGKLVWHMRPLNRPMFMSMAAIHQRGIMTGMREPKKW